jgi:hypothetical protein
VKHELRLCVEIGCRVRLLLEDDDALRLGCEQLGDADGASAILEVLRIARLELAARRGGKRDDVPQ